MIYVRFVILNNTQYVANIPYKTHRKYIKQNKIKQTYLQVKGVYIALT